MMQINREKLREIRASLKSAEVLLHALGIVPDEKRSNKREFWRRSPFREETRPSFHIRKSDLSWHDFGEKKGGGPLELIQQIHGFSIYHAGQWAVDKGLADFVQGVGLQTVSGLTPAPELTTKEKMENRVLPGRLSLVKYFDYPHPMLEERGISPKTAQTLRFGYLPDNTRACKTLKGRIVFQIRGVRFNGNGEHPISVLLSHIGRSVREMEPKWKFFKHFHSSLELYNMDRILLDKRTRNQTRKHGLMIVEGCFDVAKLFEAGMYNTVATFGAHLTSEQAEKLKLICNRLAVPRIVIFFDRDRAGFDGTASAMENIDNATIGVPVYSFDWKIRFRRDAGMIEIPETINDVCDFSVRQLQFLRKQNVV